MEGRENCRSGDPSRQQQYYKTIIDFLDENAVEYKTVNDHERTFTSEESARVRGVPLSTGGKALLLKIGGGDNNSGDNNDDAHSFSLFVMSASRKLNSKAIKKEFKSRGKASKNIRFATSEELAEITGGLVPGCVPPFGRPVLKLSNGDRTDDDDQYLDLYVDTSIGEENEIIAFNAGSLTDSVIMSVEDYIRISKPTGIFTFSKKQ
jgi:prolyl-tRNA editing enzyme YbaK/EbsC (Cys-tRNA(Pro) deacylase)